MRIAVRVGATAVSAWPALPARRVRSFDPAADAASALSQLRAGAEDVGRLPFVDAAGAPAEVPAAEHGGSLVDGGGGGPWAVRVAMRGPAGGAYDCALDVELRAGAAWPGGGAAARFVTQLAHPMVDDDGCVADTALPAGAATLAEYVAKVYSLLGDPAAADLSALPEPVVRAVAAAHSPLPLVAPAELNARRLRAIARYAPLRRHPALFAPWPEEWFADSVRDALRSGTRAAWSRVAADTAGGGSARCFDLLTPEACDMLVDECDGFLASGLPVKRPNSMNNYGVVLNDIGLEAALSELQRTVLAPIARAAFPGPGSAVDAHHSFTVRYRADEDLGLAMHTDDSDVTFNICLGREWGGSGMTICGVLGSADHRHYSTTVQHVKGRCVAHLGRLRHGADRITDGTRVNLIIWCRSTEYRRTDAFLRPAYQKESGPPDERCLSHVHDRDFGNFLPYPPGTEASREQGWCPPPGAEYDGFGAPA